MIKGKIREFAKTLGIEELGFSKTAVVALFPYYVKGETGNISMYARGIDYHITGREKLEKLAEFIRTLGASQTLVHIDNGVLDDRKAALDAGLGFMGKSGMIISPRYGSYIFIGQVVHDLAIEADEPLNQTCMSCGACISRCPGGALSEDGFEIQRCLSEISQRKGELTEGEAELLKNSGLCWGCDVCQAVCPHNRGLETTAMPEFLVDRINKLNLRDIEDICNREFREKYGRYAFSWRGKAPLQRNLRVLFEKEQL